MSIEEQFARLPVWAKNHIRQLECDNAELKEQLAQAQAQPTDNVITPIAWNEFIGGYHALPDRANIVFTLDAAKRHRIEAGLRNVDGETTFRIHADSTLVICPMASNSINITVKR